MKSFNISQFVVDFAQSHDNKIIDQQTIPNLLYLDSYDLISIVLRKKCNIFIQFGQNHSKAFLDMLYVRIEATNAILRSIGNLHYLIISKKNDEENPNTIEESLPSYSDDFNENVVQLLVKLGILKTSFKLCCEDLPMTQITSEENSVFFNKNINDSLCTNCGDCITYCPTQAFSYGSQKQSILFQSGNCIGCNICEELCQENAIEKDYDIDLIAFAFDQKTEKINFNTLQEA